MRTAMLSAMRNAHVRILILLSWIPFGASHAQSTAPQLQSLQAGDAIELWSRNFSEEDMAFLKQLTGRMIAECVKNPQTNEHRRAADLFGRIRVEHIAISPSRPSGLVVQGTGACMCDAFGNCPFWIIDHQPQPTVVLKARSIQNFALQKSLTAGHFDLVLGSHLSAMVTNLQNFQFNGKRYQRKGCASLAWADEYGTLIIPPRITPEPCR